MGCLPDHFKSGGGVSEVYPLHQLVHLVHYKHLRLGQEALKRCVVIQINDEDAAVQRVVQQKLL
ncbi:hypothetical protein GMPD_37990 [Geomonas paludis]|uniref:Uncharacterized protein n=1 Tax=Geomonas paludis TaxID=2740185 RepID=A0A6V8N0J5_9BACT|nr:hypothetical protein GMPD_37990 [Geomonas paludis]